MNKELPLLQALIDYHKEENIIFSMPGNKCGLAFSRDEIGNYVREKSRKSRYNRSRSIR